MKHLYNYVIYWISNYELRFSYTMSEHSSSKENEIISFDRKDAVI